MKTEIAWALVEAGADMGIDIKLYAEYSGRGMYGEKTAGVTYAKESDLMKAAAYASANIAEGNDDGLELPDFIDGLPERRDNMGHDMIAY